MIRIFFQKVFRNISKNKATSLINLSGLVIGISSFIMILLYVHEEFSFDRFNEKSSRIFKVTIAGNFNTIAPLAVIIKDKVPEIEKVVRVDSHMGGGKSPVLKALDNSESKRIQVNDIIYADSGFLDLFSYEVIQGSEKESLAQPNSIVLTRSTAIRLFGNDNAIGKDLEFIGTNENPKSVYKVTAIIKDVPDNSSIKFNGIVSFNTLKSIKPGGVDVDEDFGNWTYDTYALMKESCSADNLSQKANSTWFDFISRKFGVDINSADVKENVLGFIPLLEVNFYKNNKLSFIYLILFVGIIIIVLAIINFVNISIAKASLRTKEIGVRKISGSGRFSLVRQFIGETIGFTLAATILALMIVYFLLPGFNYITGKAISSHYLLNPKVLLFLITGSVITGIIAGLYPAVYLSSFRPIAIIKNEKIIANKNGLLTQFLIIFQFIISIALVISTITISRQVKQMRTGDLGFDDRNIITCKLTKSVNSKYDVFKQALLQNSNIVNVAASSGSGLTEQFHMDFSEEINGSKKTYYGMIVDPDFVKTIGLNVIEGRDFSWDLESDKNKAVILNETAVRNFGLKDPIGFEIKVLNYKARVIGVIKDFHNESFRSKISSLVMWYVPGYSYNLSIRMNGNNIPGTINYIKEQWEKFAPDIPFEFQFLDKKYDALYKEEDKLSLVIGYFSLVAILIACLGLFGLASFITQNRTKEIGIRKVNGARVSEILAMLNTDFVKSVLIAFPLAAPIGWCAMHKWLEGYAYKTEMSWWIFVLSGSLALGVALLTVSWQSWKAATRNPVEALRYE